MNYENIINLLLDTDASQWESVSGQGEYRFCKVDVNLRIVSTCEGGDIQQEPFHEDWANCYPKQGATGYFYNMYYGSTLVRRFTLVAVNGASALLPVPEIGSKFVNKTHWKVAKIFDTTGALEEYMERSGLLLDTSSGR